MIMPMFLLSWWEEIYPGYGRRVYPNFVDAGQWPSWRSESESESIKKRCTIFTKLRIFDDYSKDDNIQCYIERIC